MKRLNQIVGLLLLGMLNFINCTDCLAFDREADVYNPPVMVALSGKMYRAIEIAVRELASHGLNNVTGYRIKAVEANGSILIYFQDNDEHTNPGSGPYLPGYGVTLDSEHLTIISSHYLR